MPSVQMRCPDRLSARGNYSLIKMQEISQILVTLAGAVDQPVVRAAFVFATAWRLGVLFSGTKVKGAAL